MRSLGSRFAYGAVYVIYVLISPIVGAAALMAFSVEARPRNGTGWGAGLLGLALLAAIFLLPITVACATWVCFRIDRAWQGGRARSSGIALLRILAASLIGGLAFPAVLFATAFVIQIVEGGELSDYHFATVHAVAGVVAAIVCGCLSFLVLRSRGREQKEVEKSGDSH